MCCCLHKRAEPRAPIAGAELYKDVLLFIWVSYSAFPLGMALKTIYEWVLLPLDYRCLCMKHQQQMALWISSNWAFTPIRNSKQLLGCKSIRILQWKEAILLRERRGSGKKGMSILAFLLWKESSYANVRRMLQPAKVLAQHNGLYSLGDNPRDLPAAVAREPWKWGGHSISLTVVCVTGFVKMNGAKETCGGKWGV